MIGTNADAVLKYCYVLFLIDLADSVVVSGCWVTGRISHMIFGEGGPGPFPLDFSMSTTHWREYSAQFDVHDINGSGVKKEKYLLWAKLGECHLRAHYVIFVIKFF